MMTQGGKSEQALKIVAQISEMIEFAEGERDFVVAAKLEDVRVLMIAHFIDGKK